MCGIKDRTERRRDRVEGRCCNNILYNANLSCFWCEGIWFELRKNLSVQVLCFCFWRNCNSVIYTIGNKFLWWFYETSRRGTWPQKMRKIMFVIHSSSILMFIIYNVEVLCVHLEFCPHFFKKVNQVCQKGEWPKYLSWNKLSG